MRGPGSGKRRVAPCPRSSAPMGTPLCSSRRPTPVPSPRPWDGCCPAGPVGDASSRWRASAAAGKRPAPGARALYLGTVRRRRRRAVPLRDRRARGRARRPSTERARPGRARERSRQRRGASHGHADGPLQLARLVRPGDRLLDFGCGGGRHCPRGHAPGRRRHGPRLRPQEAWWAPTAGWRRCWTRTRRRPRTGGQGHVVVGDGVALPFPDGCFDKVIAAEVLEHVPDDAAVLAELARVLRPGGRWPSPCPAGSPRSSTGRSRREYHNIPGGHVRIYRRAPAAPTGCAAPAWSRSAGAPCACPPQPVLVVAVRRRHRPGGQPARAGLSPAPRLGHHGKEPAHPLARGGAEPGARQEPRHLRPQAMTREPGSVGGRDRPDGRVDSVAAAAQRDGPLVPGRPRRPLEPRRGDHGPRRRRALGRSRAGL